MTRILLTGATGNVGHATLRALRSQPSMDSTLVAAVRNPDAARQQLGSDADGVELVAFDFAQPTTWTAALAGVSRLLLVRPPSEEPENILRFLDHAKAAGVQHVVYLSVQGAQYLFFIPHYRIERHLQKLGLGYTFLRASFFMQNLSTTHQPDIRDYDQLLLPAGRGKTSFIDVRDIGEVAAKVLRTPYAPNAAYELTGSEALTYYEVAAIFSRELGRPITYRAASIKEFRTYMEQVRGIVPAFAKVMVGIYLTARFGVAGRITPTVQQLLGHPPITLRQFVQDYHACWQKPPVPQPAA